MKILWVKADFLHPTTKGGHIRTLEMLRRMRTRHEVHYLALSPELNGEGVRRSSEYCHRAYPVLHRAPKRGSLAFAGQLASSLFSPLPLAVSRYRSEEMTAELQRLLRDENFDSVVCDFLAPAPNIPDLGRCVLFQHNVETMIWRRHAETAPDVAQKLYFREQARKMFEYEGAVCRKVQHVIGVSRIDADLMRSMFGIKDVSHVSTGVDVEYFTPAAHVAERRADLVFVGSMDWLPNIDGVSFFFREVLPLIRQERPGCSVAIVGRDPGREIRSLAEQDPLTQVTGTVPDVRPYMWGASVSIVPLRIGGGTRMKIYEAMAARLPVVSTTIGAEGLTIHPPDDIRIGDTPQEFARHCLELLGQEDVRRRQAEAAWDLVARNFGWDNIARQFESILAQCPYEFSAAVRATSELDMSAGTHLKG